MAPGEKYCRCPGCGQCPAARAKKSRAKKKREEGPPEKPRSPRGFDLVHTLWSQSFPTLTCELYEKWYRLFLVHPDGRVEAADLEGLEAFTEGTAEGDHCWNPTALEGFAEARGWRIDPVAHDLIVGRWVLNMGLEL